MATNALTPTIKPAVLPAAPTPRAAALSPLHAPLVHAQKMNTLLAQMAARSLGTQATLAWTLPWHLDTQTWQELQAMQAAVWKRLGQQQAEWVKGCQQLMQDYAQLKQANTLSKVVDQEYDFVSQFGALLSSQASALAGLAENIQVDLGYWVSQKADEQKVAQKNAVEQAAEAA